MKFAIFILLFYILGINLVFAVNDSLNSIDSSRNMDDSIFNEYEQSKNKYQESVFSPEMNNGIYRDLSAIDNNLDKNILKNKFIALNSTSFSHYPNSEFSTNLGLFSNLLISPIMDKSAAILGELSFKYSLDGIRAELVSVEHNYSPAKLVNKLFGPRGTKNNARLLRYGFLSALMDEINNRFLKKTDLKYKLHPKLLTEMLEYKECVDLLNDANQHIILLATINKVVFEIICEQVINNNLFIKMQSWDKQVLKIISYIQKNVDSIRENLDVKSRTIKMSYLPKVPEIKVNGKDIKLRYLNIVKSIDTIKKKEYALFKSLIFTKKIAVKISTQYLQNGEELVQRCIDIIKSENPALMRETYQKEKLEQICRISMGN